MSVRRTSTAYAADLPPKRNEPRARVGVVGRLLLLASVIAVVIAGGHAVRLLIDHARIVLAYPYPLNYGESPLLDQAVRLSAGENLYPADLSVPPYTITNYPPVYLLAQVPFVRAVGAAFWYGRLISLVSAAAAALFIAAIIRVLFKDGIAALVGGLVFISMPYLLHWSGLARIDTLALALSLGGLFLIAWQPEIRTINILSMILLAAAAYTRQTYLLAAPLAATVWLWGRVSPVRAITFAILYAVLILGIFLPLLVVTHGGIFFHIVTANVNALDSSLVNFYIDEFLRWLPIALAAGALWLIFGWIHVSRAWWLLTAYLLGGFAVAFTISKVGSDINYLYELIAGLSLAFGALIGAMRSVPALKAVFVGAAAAQILLLIGLSDVKYYALSTERISERQAGMDRLAAVIAAEDVPILADEHAGLLTLAGRRISLQPFEMTQLAAAGIWDETPLLDAMRRGEYPLVLMYNPMLNPELRMERWSPRMRQVINQYYRAEMQAAETLVYRYFGE